ncbi:MAG: uL15 family ribosomal protein, partial [Ignavibacteriaceae bacterium]
NAASLKSLGLVSSAKQPIKILAKGELKAKVNLKVHAFSGKAKEKIEAAGGSIKKI